jgi:hypothetical protein
MPPSSRAGRTWFGLTAAAVFAGVLIQVLVSAGNEHGLFPAATGRVFNVSCYFTIQSNLVVGITNPLFHTALSGLVDLEGWAKVADQFFTHLCRCSPYPPG